MYWLALNHTVNGRTPLSKLIVKAVAPLRSLPLGMELAAMNTQQREAEDIRPHTGTNTTKELIGTFSLLFKVYFCHLEHLLAEIQVATAVVGSCSLLDTPTHSIYLR